MNELVKHLWATNRQEIISRSRANCHVVGVDSIVLLECPGKTIRLYFADWNHSLWKNQYLFGGFPHPLSAAVHPHHCHLTLAPVLGAFENIRVWKLSDKLTPMTAGLPKLTEYIFDSKLLGGTGGFVEGSGEVFVQPDMIRYTVGSGPDCHMAPSDLHTVYVEKEERAAWLVFEGPSSPDYKPVAYSNHDLTKWSPNKIYDPVTNREESLYQPMEADRIVRLLKITKLL